MYNFAFAVCVFLNTVCIFISLRRDVYSFKVVSSGKVKKVIMRTGVSENVRTPEEMEFSEYLGDGADVAVIKKTDFVSDFFARRRERPKSTAALKIFLPVCLGVAVIFFFLAKFAMDQTVAESFGTAYATFLMTAPFAAFFSYAYPIYLASRRAYTYNSAIVGDKTPEEYENTAVVAFRDEDAFPAGKIKVRGIKIFADRNIENVVYYASSVFSKLGGPLSSVFRQATLNSVNSEDVEIREIANEGVCAMVDGKISVLRRCRNRAMRSTRDSRTSGFSISPVNRSLLQNSIFSTIPPRILCISCVIWRMRAYAFRSEQQTLVLTTAFCMTIR